MPSSRRSEPLTSWTLSRDRAPHCLRFDRRSVCSFPAETIEAALKPENKEQLEAVLTYHVVAGKVMSADVVKMKSAENLKGQEVKLRVRKGTVMIEGARVVKTDIATSNDVIPVIDTVIIPENLGELSD